MPDRHSHELLKRDAALAAALRDLPPHAPPQDLWPLVRARARRRRRLRRIGRIALPAAAAVVLAVGLSWWHGHGARPDPQPRAVRSTLPAAGPGVEQQLARWRHDSQRLQELVQVLDRGGAPLDGRELARAAGLQDRIGLVDLQLNTARTPHARLPLWRQRVTLLRQLAVLHVTAGHRQAARPVPAAARTPLRSE